MSNMADYWMNRITRMRKYAAEESWWDKLIQREKKTLMRRWMDDSRDSVKKLTFVTPTIYAPENAAYVINSVYGKRSPYTVPVTKGKHKEAEKPVQYPTYGSDGADYWSKELELRQRFPGMNPEQRKKEMAENAEIERLGRTYKRGFGKAINATTKFFSRTPLTVTRLFAGK